MFQFHNIFLIKHYKRKVVKNCVLKDQLRERLKCTPSWLILLAEFVVNLFMSFIIFYINASKFKKVFETLAFLD